MKSYYQIRVKIAYFSKEGPSIESVFILRKQIGDKALNLSYLDSRDVYANWHENAQGHAELIAKTSNETGWVSLEEAFEVLALYETGAGLDKLKSRLIEEI